MTVALFLESQKTNQYFFFSLMQQGHKIRGFTKTQAVLEFLEKNECALIFVDYESIPKEQSDFFLKIHLNSEKTQIVLITLQSSFKMNKILLENKIYGVIAKPISYPKLQLNIQEYIERVLQSPVFSKRKYPRFDIESNHNVIKLNFPDMNSSHIGKIDDISLGGMAVHLRKNASKYIIFKGKKVACQVELEDLAFNFEAKIANFNGSNRIGLLFYNLNPHDRKKIKDFILNKMIEEKTQKE